MKQDHVEGIVRDKNQMLRESIKHFIEFFPSPKAEGSFETLTYQG